MPNLTILTSKFADDTMVLGLINNNDESAYRGEVQLLASCCENHNLAIDIKNTKDITVGFQETEQSIPTPLSIGSDLVESH